MDAETKLEIEQANKRVIAEISTMIDKLSSDIKEWFKIQFDPEKEQMRRVRDDIAELYERDRKQSDRIALLEQRQSHDEGQNAGSKTAKETHVNSVNIWIGVISLIIAASGVVAGIIVAHG